MAESITFRGAVLKHFDMRQAKEGAAAFVRIHMSADYSEQVREKMEWERVPDSIMEAKLSGGLSAIHLVLTPGDKQLRNHELQFEISSVEDFQVVPLKDDEGEIRGRELRFVVRTPAEVEGFLGQYIRRVGRHQGACKVSYTKQEELPLTAQNSPSNEAKKEESEETDTGCVPCNNDLPMESPGVHVNGAKCTRHSLQEASTLATAREAAGGTHARKRREGDGAQVN